MGHRAIRHNERKVFGKQFSGDDNNHQAFSFLSKMSQCATSESAIGMDALDNDDDDDGSEFNRHKL